MAYLSAEALAFGEVVDTREAVRFSPLELRVIALGERADATRERRPRAGLARVADWLFGLAPAGPLADPRLEALRCFASKARHHRAALGEEDVEALVTAGYTVGQVRGLSGWLAARSRSGASA